MTPIPESGASKQPPPIAHSGLLQQKIDADTVDSEFFSLFHKQVKSSQETRFLKVAKLTPEQRDKLSQLEKMLTLLHQNIQKLQSLENDKTVLPNDGERNRLTEQIIRIEEEIQEGFTPFLLQVRTALKIPYELNLAFYTESVLNAFVNRASYVNEIKATLDGELQKIVSFFNLPPSKISEIEFPPNETHNEGKSTCFIHLQGQESSTKLVYKPRNARVDEIVIATFQKINAIPIITDKSASFDLPTYRIYQCDRENASIWEYISDKSLRKSFTHNPPSLGSYVANMNDNLLIKAVRMDEVLSLLHIGDLHGENIMLRKGIDQSIDFVPIDLEVVHFPRDSEQNTKTELGTQSIRQKLISEGKYKGLTDAEKAIIRDMRKSFFSHISRFVPLGTYHLVKQLVDLSNYRLISELFKNEIINEGFIPVKDMSRLLQENVLLDYLNNDVPYLSSQEGNLYYGSPNRGILLARMEA